MITEPLREHIRHHPGLMLRSYLPIISFILYFSCVNPSASLGAEPPTPNPDGEKFLKAILLDDATVFATGGQALLDYGSSVRQWPSVSYSAPEVWRDYRVNEIAADKKYLGKMFNIEGVVLSVSKSQTDHPIVELASSGTPIGNLMAVLDIQMMEEAAEYKLGRKVKLACKGAGIFFARPAVEDCESASLLERKREQFIDYQIGNWFANDMRSGFIEDSERNRDILFQLYWAGSNLKHDSPCIKEPASETCLRSIQPALKARRGNPSFLAAHKKWAETLHLPAIK